MNTLSMESAVYLACALDSEGYIGANRRRWRGKIRRQNESVVAATVVSNTALPWIQEFQRETGCGHILTHSFKDARKPGYGLQFRVDEIRHILPQVLPWLRIKKRHAELVLELCGLPRGDLRKQSICDELHDLNRRGYDGRSRKKVTVFAPKKCAECGREFLPKVERHRFCSEQCNMRSYMRERYRQAGAQPRYPDGLGYKARKMLAT